MSFRKRSIFLLGGKVILKLHLPHRDHICLHRAQVGPSLWPVLSQFRRYRGPPVLIYQWAWQNACLPVLHVCVFLIIICFSWMKKKPKLRRFCKEVSSYYSRLQMIVGEREFVCTFCFYRQNRAAPRSVKLLFVSFFSHSFHFSHSYPF